MPYATDRFNKIIAAETIRFIVTVAIVVYKGLKLVVYRMLTEKVNYQEVYDLYQLCSETKDLREFCADYGVNYDKFMNWQRHQLWSEKLGKTVQVEQPKVAKVRITGKPCNSPTVKLEVKQPEGESPIKWVKLQLTSGATLFLRNTTVLDLSLLLNKMIG